MEEDSYYASSNINQTEIMYPEHHKDNRQTGFTKEGPKIDYENVPLEELIQHITKNADQTTTTALLALLEQLHENNQRNMPQPSHIPNYQNEPESNYLNY